MSADESDAAAADAAATADALGAVPVDDGVAGEPLLGVALPLPCRSSTSPPSSPAQIPVLAVSPEDSDSEKDSAVMAGAPVDGVGVAATHDRQGRRENNAPSPLLEFRCRVRCVAPGLATTLKRLVERHQAGGCVRRISENEGRLDLEKSVTELVIVGPPSSAIRACAAVKNVLRSEYLVQVVSAEPTELSRRPPSWTATVDYDGFTASEAEDDAAAAADSEVDYLNVKHRDARPLSEVPSSGGLLKTVAFYMPWNW